MMRTNVETAGGDGGDGDGLRGSPMNAPREGVLDAITTRQRSDTPSVEQKECLRVSKTVVESSERPRTVLGATPSGKSRLIQLAAAYTVGIVPQTVAVIVRQAGGRRVEVTVNVLDDSIGIVDMHDLRGRDKELF